MVANDQMLLYHPYTYKLPPPPHQKVKSGATWYKTSHISIQNTCLSRWKLIVVRSSSEKFLNILFSVF